MRVVDTSAWLEWILRIASWRRKWLTNCRRRAAWIVPTIVQYELARCLERESLLRSRLRTIAFSTACVVRFLDTEVAVQAAEITRTDRGLAMADSIIYATAIDTGADLLTCDAHFAELPQVVYFAKGAR